ncbi:RBKS isoform 3 [Pan troglodytes]|uniref:RBKS isoform 3 n=1 Tax=Pan troglodytes TaxID=9598 RepID=A0A2J8K0N9_PANTR|nr:RBKS isoform 3 [Pan troglodytes]
MAASGESQRQWQEEVAAVVVVGSCMTDLVRRMCMRICYVPFCCQPTPQLQNCSSLCVITCQEN